MASKKKDIVSTSLCHVPFLNSCDVTRLQMVNKYYSSQAMPHLNNEFPKIVSEDTYKASVYSDGRFIKHADDDGTVLYKDDTILIVYYTNLNKYEIYEIAEYKHLSSIFGTRIRYVIDKQTFKKGEILYEYAGFIDGISAPGINARVAFMPFNMYNHEDAIVISQSFADKFRYYEYEEIYVPIYVNSKLRKVNGKLLPNIGDIYEEDDVLIAVDESGKPNNLDTLLAKLDTHRNASDRTTKTKLHKSKVLNIEVYKLSNKFVEDAATENLLNELSQHTTSKIKDIKKKLQSIFNDTNTINKIINKYYNIKKVKNKNIRNVKDLVYLIRIELVNENGEFYIGDKISTRGANKGVISKIVPDELMPVDELGRRIDVIISPLAIPSRMNVNQIYEMHLADLVEFAETKLREGDDETAFNIILDITEKFGRNFHNITKAYIEKIKNDSGLYTKFIKNVEKYGLFVIVDSFKDKKYTKKDIIDIYKKYNYPILKKVKIKARQLKEYMMGQYDENIPEEVEVKVFTGTMYIYRLFKIARYMMNARSVGLYHSILKIPTRGKSKQGGSRIGNNEIDMLLSFDSQKVLKEFITIKADDHEHKKEFLESIVFTGKYNIENIEYTKSYILETIKSLAKTLYIDLDNIVDLEKRSQINERNKI